MVKEITMPHNSFLEMKDKMLKVLVNLEDIQHSGQFNTKQLETMISDMKDALKLAIGKVHGISEEEILQLPKNEGGDYEK